MSQVRVDTRQQSTIYSHEAHSSFRIPTETYRSHKADTRSRSPCPIPSGTCLLRMPCSCPQTRIPAPSGTSPVGTAGTPTQPSPLTTARTAPPSTACSCSEPWRPAPFGRSLPCTTRNCSRPMPRWTFGTFPARTARSRSRQIRSDTGPCCTGGSRRHSACPSQTDTALVDRQGSLSCLSMTDISPRSTWCNSDLSACQCLFDTPRRDTLCSCVPLCSTGMLPLHTKSSSSCPRQFEKYQLSSSSSHAGLSFLALSELYLRCKLGMNHLFARRLIGTCRPSTAGRPERHTLSEKTR